MEIRAAEISSILKNQIAKFGAEADVAETGQVVSVGDGVARVYGLDKVKAAYLPHPMAYPQRFVIDASIVGPRADLTTDRAALTLQHRFNRLTLQLRGAVLERDYSTVPSTEMPVRITSIGCADAGVHSSAVRTFAGRPRRALSFVL